MSSSEWHLSHLKQGIRKSSIIVQFFEYPFTRQQSLKLSITLNGGHFQPTLDILVRRVLWL